jgi:hypothetical protein
MWRVAAGWALAIGALDALTGARITLSFGGRDGLLTEADARLSMVKAKGKDGLPATSVDVPPDTAAIRRSVHSTDRMVLA